ncbi:uncharacterized protein LOC123551764 isoform X2 [Mercenaria mercenaria]|uniref:uncharacterized protein LOC123551764 isoform X2 n=1 Tax=Mercenaria mercenaria TaxID=6596 RepID=UPI00234F7D46|nr:uncharacterized protein LOC123551764 isoform X2 [Mercenaria mercenaria]
MRVFIHYLFICIFLLGYLQGKNVQLLCGSNLQLYNPTTHVCANGQLFKRSNTSSLGQTSTSLVSFRKPKPSTEQRQSRLSCLICRLGNDIHDRRFPNATYQHTPVSGTSSQRPRNHIFTVKPEICVTGATLIYLGILK